MPDDVAARIEASLAVAADELRRRPVEVPGRAPWANNRSHAGRSSSRTIAALAAGFLVIAGAGVFGLQSLESGTSDAPPMAVTPPSTHRSPSQATPTNSAPPSSAASPRPAPSTPLFTASKTDYTHGDLAKQATALWAAAGSNPSFTLPSLSAEQPGLGPLATPMGLADCVAALGIDAPARVVADFARYGGRPAAVLLTSNGSTVQVHVVERTCRTGRAGVIAEPVTFPVPNG